MDLKPVLYVEDEDNDAFLMQRAFRKVNVTNPLRILPDGAEALAYLAGSGAYADRRQYPTPCLLLLDLNLPRKSGLEILKWVRDQPEFETLTVVVFTSSIQERDIASAYSLGANGYVVKPANAAHLLDIVATLRDTCLPPSAPARGWLNFKGGLPPPVPIEHARN